MIEELQKLGLDLYESKALGVLFEGKFSLRELSKKSVIPFGKVYSVIKSLKEKGFVKETNTRPKFVYVEDSSYVISILIKKKKEEDRKLNEKLRDLSSQIEKSKGRKNKFFEIGTTVEDNKRIQSRSFKEAEKEVLQILNVHHKPKSNRKSKTLWEKEIEEAISRGVTFKSIYPIKAILPKTLEKLNKKVPKKFNVKRFDTDFMRVDIIDGEKVLLKMVQTDPLQFGGVLFIEDEKLAENLKKIFYEMWKEAD